MEMIPTTLVEKLMPPDNHVETKGMGVWLLTYKNAGKLRITYELIGILIPIKPKKSTGKEETTVAGAIGVRLLSTGQIMTRKAFEEYRRKTWPAPHEKERNPDNITLGVQSGVGKGIGGFK